MNKKSVILLLLITGATIVAMLLSGCEPRRHAKHNPNQKHVVKSYRVRGDNNDWLYWYIIMNNKNNCIYASSPTPVSPVGYSSLNWQSGKTPPAELNEKEAEEIGEQEATEAELGTEGESTMEQMEFDFSENDTTVESSSETSGSESSGGDSGSSSGDSSGGGDGGGGGGGE